MGFKINICLCFSVIQLWNWCILVGLHTWFGRCIRPLCYKLIRFVCTGKLFFSFHLFLSVCVFVSVQMLISFIFAVVKMPCLSLCMRLTICVHSLVRSFARTLLVCFPHSEYYELFKWVFHSFNFFPLSLSLSAYLFHVFVARSLRPHQ